ncbi:MAG: DUF748 domain-containing protein, partial [Ramlibacter sp.]|nr:DUF748 domain-containing protein [Ramlibacter sp.]
APEPAAANGDWKLAVAQLVFDDIALSAVDETVKPALTLDAGKARLQLQLQAGRAAAADLLTVAGAALSVDELTLASGGATPVKVARLGFDGGSFDLASRRVNVERVFAEGGHLQLVRDRKGDLNLVQILPAAGAAANEPAVAAAPGQPWLASVKSVEWSRFGAQVDDQGLGVKVNVNDFTGKLEGAGSDLKQPVRFSGELRLREGGQFSTQGSVVPGSGALQADVRIKQLALAPLQPLLARHVKLKIARGNVSAHGKLNMNSGNRAANMRYVGAVNVAGLTLNEEDGELFAAWKNVSADRLTATLGPDRVEVPELRIVEPEATLIIEPDRSFNAARLLVQPPASVPTTAMNAAPAAQPFPVQIRRVRLENAKLDFADLSLQPQFAAKIHELNGVINGLSSSRDARSQLELDGRVGEFGLARVRGELNPFAPSNNTDVNVVFKNVDLVPTSPYAMKFAGYRIAQGKISLDLQYKLRNRQLEGANQIVIDQLTLGERVESPDALKLPLALAIAILKDSDGRIDLGLPVSGDMNDPQFSYGAIIWKAIGNLLTKIVTAPFRALGALLGVSGEKLESIEFDPGSDKLLPPEREKIKQLAQLLAKRAQLKLSVPAQYSETADGAALRARAVRTEIARRAGLKLAAGEEPGPLDLGDRAVRVAVRELFAARFGDAELDKQKKAAETAAAAAPSGAASSAESAQAKLPMWQRVGKMIQGEPQVADAGAFYKNLLERLNESERLDPQALTQLATNRSNAILALLNEAGVQPARAAATAPEKVSAEAGKPIHLKLSLGAS